MNKYVIIHTVIIFISSYPIIYFIKKKKYISGAIYILLFLYTLSFYYKTLSYKNINVVINNISQKVNEDLFILNGSYLICFNLEPNYEMPIDFKQCDIDFDIKIDNKLIKEYNTYNIDKETYSIGFIYRPDNLLKSNINASITQIDWEKIKSCTFEISSIGFNEKNIGFYIQLFYRILLLLVIYSFLIWSNRIYTKLQDQ